MATQGASSNQEPLAVLFEREGELRQLEALLSEAQAGEGRVAVIEGPAGVGKTSLMDAALAEADKAGMRVLRGRAGELEAAFPFGLCHQLFGAILQSGDERRREQLFSGAAAHARLVFGEGEPQLGVPSEDLLFPRLHGLYWLTANLASETPTVVAVDEAQWTDTPSLRFLDFLARRADGVSVALLLTVRSGEPQANERLLSELAARPETLRLRPAHLSESAVAELVRLRIGSAEDDFCRACAEATGGNPLYVRELLAGGAVIHTDTPSTFERLPEQGLESVGRNVVSRIARTGPGATDLARAAAMLGDRAPLRLVSRLAEVEPADAVETVDRLAAAEILGAAGDEVSFTHPIVRQAVYADIPAAGRARDHARAADILHREAASGEVVCSQLLRGERRGEQWAVATLRSVAREAQRRGAVEIAAEHLERALEEPPDPRTRAEVLMELGSVLMLAGDPRCAELLREALELAETPEQRGGIASILGQALIYSARAPEAVPVLRSALDDLDESALLLRTILRTELIGTALVDLESRRLVGSELATARAEAAGMDPVLSGPLLGILAFEALSDAPAGASRELASRALERGQLLSWLPPDHPAVVFAIGALLVTSDEPECRRHLDEAAGKAAGSGSARAFAAVCCLRSRGSFRWGEINEAEDDARTALELIAEHGWSVGLPVAVACLMDPLIERGDIEGAKRTLAGLPLDGADTEAHAFQQVRESRARLRLAEGRPGEALEDAFACGEWEQAWGASNSIFSHYPWRTTAALAALATGDLGTAAKLSGEAVQTARGFGDARTTGVALRVAALVEAGERRIAMLREAESLLASSPARLDHAKALLDLGTALRVGGQRRAAREPLGEALQIADRCGGEIVAERARSELLASGARPRRPQISGADALTPSERRVAELAAGGLSNPEIAQALFVTRKTIEMHLSRAYRKLAIAGRGEIGDALSTSEIPATA